MIALGGARQCHSGSHCWKDRAEARACGSDAARRQRGAQGVYFRIARLILGRSLERAKVRLGIRITLFGAVPSKVRTKSLITCVVKDNKADLSFFPENYYTPAAELKPKYHLHKSSKLVLHDAHTRQTWSLHLRHANISPIFLQSRRMSGEFDLIQINMDDELIRYQVLEGVWNFAWARVDLVFAV